MNNAIFKLGTLQKTFCSQITKYSVTMSPTNAAIRGWFQTGAILQISEMLCNIAQSLASYCIHKNYLLHTVHICSKEIGFHFLEQ